MRRAITLTTLVMILALSGCAGRAPVYRFAARPPAETAADTRPSPLPEKTSYAAASYSMETLVRRPVQAGLTLSIPRPAGDVNALDDVPASSWFTPRLGYLELSPDDLLRGPEQTGPPQMPITVVKAKSGGGNPGFIVKDRRGATYLIKFDPPDYPAIETTTALIVNRLFWGFGYNVPEDYLFFFGAQDLKVDPKGELTAGDVQEVLAQVSAPRDGRYRSTASLYVSGRILGPVADVGTRPGDLNDTVAHQDRRVLRALKVFGAFLNHSGMRIDNSLDVYLGEPGQGYVKHYLLDFGESFGGHGAPRHYLWDGFESYFGFSQFFGNLATLGLHVRDWEKLHYTPWPSVGIFEAEAFRPEGWKPVRPYAPIDYNRPDDNYWAARILSALTREHLATLIEAARYPEPDAAAHMLDTLVRRRDKTLSYHMSRVSAVDALGIVDDVLVMERRHEAIDTCTIRCLDASGCDLTDAVSLETSGGACGLPGITALLEAADGYLIVEVLAQLDGTPAPRAAQFHIRRLDGNPALVGVVH